jgi:hypothetical protein
VIVAGEAWVRGKGFTRDATSPESYRAILDELPFSSRLGQHEHERAVRYAYHFFFRRMIELPFMTDPKPGIFEIEIDHLDSLGPGNFSGLDCICDGILEGTHFIMS